MLLVLLAAGAVQTVDPAMVKSPDSERCDPAIARAATLTPAEARKLGRLPPGGLQLAVYKRVGGCGVTVLPTRDANGNHLMLFGGGRRRVGPAHEGTSGRDRRPQRQR